MWEVIVSVYCGDVFVGKLKTNIVIGDIPVELFVCGIKFIISAYNDSVTVSTSSSNLELTSKNSWYTGRTSEPIRNRDKALEEFSFDVEATQHRIGM